MTYEPPPKLIPLFSQLFAPFDRAIGKTSLTNGMRKLRDRLFGRENVTVLGLTPKSKSILSGESVILICNHPFDTEVILLLGSLPERRDIRMVGADSQVRMGREFAKYIFRVYPFRQEREGKDLKLSSRVARYTYRKDSGLSNEEMQKRNREAISQAAKWVDRGGLTVMFPQGTSSKIAFRSGIGHLVSQLKLKKPTYLCFAYISGCTNLDFFRIAPGLNLILPRPIVSFGSPQKLTKKDLQKEPKQIAADLEKSYLRWIGSL